MGIGSIEFKVSNNDGDRLKTIRLDNAWYIPSCTKSLISGSQLFSARIGIYSSLSGLCITQGPDVTIATTRLKEGHFNLNLVSSSYSYSSISYLSSSRNSSSRENIPFNTYNSSFITLDICSDPVLLLHNRFAHVSPRLVPRIGISEDMPANLKAKLSIDLSKRCEVCMSYKKA